MRQKAISRKLISLTAMLAVLTFVSSAFLLNAALGAELKTKADGATVSGKFFGNRYLSEIKNRIFSFTGSNLRRADIATAEIAPSSTQSLFRQQTVPAKVSPLWLLNRALLL